LRAALDALRPCVQAVDDEAVQLDLWCDALVKAAGLEAKARAADASGATSRELERLRAEARAGAAEGLSPRDWTQTLVAGREKIRAENRSEPDAITVQTCHSAKGLEWPAVLVPGLWREISFDNGRGLQVRREADGTPVVYLKTEDVPEDTQISRTRERRRELVRLLYVTLTRPRRLLLLPWPEPAGQPHEQSFAALWGHDPARLMPFDAERSVEPPEPLAEGAVAGGGQEGSGELGHAQPAVVVQAWDCLALDKITRRLLPHELAHGDAGANDLARAARHEASAEALRPAKVGEDPIAYGLWWHETLEFLPWLGSDAEVMQHGEARMHVAEQIGAGARAREEWALFLRSEAWRELRAERWRRLAELAVLAPLSDAGWMDGVMDLVLHDPVAAEVWVVDWKTNRRRAGEAMDDFLARLAAEYRPQLSAYGDSLALMFPGTRLKRLLYATGVGRWIEVSRVD
jgi:ATP-dependent exoDNAse (exonuclease V) beta subunit